MSNPHPGSTHVSFLGLGAMGSRMAGNLIKAGYLVTVWNRSEGPIQALKSQGALSATTPREAVKNAEFVFSMVRDDPASRSVWTDSQSGALFGMQANAIAIDSSTLSPDWTRELSKLCESHGVSFLEAPVAGSRPQADAGQLIYFIGGDAATLESARPLLATMGASIHHAGLVGDAAIVKLFVNALFGLQVAGIAELLGMVRNAGLDPAKALEIVGSTPVASPAVKAAGSAMLAQNFAPMFPIELVKKDFEYFLQTAKRAQSTTPLMEVVHTVLSTATQQGLGQSNITGLGALY
jgi:3-hydroxyisobutyrate dehydrogenase